MKQMKRAIVASKTLHDLLTYFTILKFSLVMNQEPPDQKWSLVHAKFGGIIQTMDPPKKSITLISLFLDLKFGNKCPNYPSIIWAPSAAVPPPPSNHLPFMNIIFCWKEPVIKTHNNKNNIFSHMALPYSLHVI